MAPNLFVKKKDGSLGLCVDYQKLNEGTLENHKILPLIQDILMHLSKTRWYTKLNVCNEYNLLRIAHYDEWKIAF